MRTIKYIIVSIFVTFFNVELGGQDIKYIKAVSGRETEIPGDLASGQQMKDLSWAWNSSVACFPAIREKRFTGNHVLYYTDLPRYSEMEVTVIPEDPSANFSLYAYEVGKVSGQNTVPNLHSCIRCEADFKWEYKRRGIAQDHTRTVSNLVALNHPYQVVIGVAGSEGLERGAYRLRIRIISRDGQ